MQRSTLFYSFFAVFLLVCVHAFAQTNAVPVIRQAINWNENWSFAKDPKQHADLFNLNSLQWSKIQIPHTWNAFDVMDDVPGCYRGIGWYKKKLILKPAWKSKNIYLYFEGVNQETEVYLNGKKIGNHIGGYTAFRIPLSNLNFKGINEITVKVNNRYHEDIPPLTADFTFFGGIYRNVSLLVLDPIHFEDEFASKGVYIHTDKVTRTNAEIIINGNLVNKGKSNNKLHIISILTDAKGRKISEVKSAVSALRNLSIPFQQPIISLKNPNLWSPETPYLYQVTTKLVEAKTNRLVDEVNLKVGLRFFSFDAERGFFLNGSPYKLVGSSRHQDYAGLGNAVPSALQVKDIVLLKEMGGNFLRVAHYPQDQAVLDACDRLGLLASVEIPIVNEITESEKFYRNCSAMQMEMIKQNYNHPSIIIWAYMNEVLLKMKFNSEPERKRKYLANIERLAEHLETLTRTTDPTRYTMMSNHGDISGYLKAGLVKIPMLVGWNLYQGWYGGRIEDFGPNLDKIHQQIPDKPMLITEFGADADPRIHSFAPIRFDKSLEYAMLYHQVYIREILKRPFVAAAAVWNLADFSSETRAETMPHINNKGLLALNRSPKNTYYLYKANFSLHPFLKIGDGGWKLRGGLAHSNDNFLTQTLQVMSNTDSVTLYLNGKNMGKKKVMERLTNWELPFTRGINKIKAVSFSNGIKFEDSSLLNIQIQPTVMNSTALPFNGINILLGSQRQFINEQKNEIWLPSQAYQKGSWGSIGGEAFQIKNSGRQSYGSDQSIRGTMDDPIYQTQMVDLERFQLDVPNGKYTVTLHFAELMGKGIQTMLPYNLDSLIAVGKEVPPQRIFDVYLNDKLVVSKMNLAATYGIASSVQKKFDCIVTDDHGIKLMFKSIQGKPVLNALQVNKID
jgi:beta-galactosidase